MGTARVILGFADLIFEGNDADTWRGGPDAAAVDEAAGFPVAALADDLPGIGHRTTDLAEASGRIGRIFDRLRLLGSFAATDHNFTARGLARFIAGEWAFRNAASAVAAASLASTTADLTASSDATYYLRFRMPPLETAAATDTWWRFGAGSGLTGYDVRLTFRSAGNPGFALFAARFSGSSNIHSFSNDIDDGRPHEIVLRLDGTANAADVLLDEVLILNQGTVPAFAAPAAASQSVHFNISGTVALDIYEFVRVTGTATISLADLRSAAIAHHQDAAPVWYMNGTFPVIDDETTTGHTATTSGTVTQIDRVNDDPAIDSGTIKPYGDWAQAEALRISQSAAVEWNRVEAPPRRFTVSFLARWEPGAVTTSGNDQMLWLGDALATADLRMQIDGGTFRFQVRRTTTLSVSLASPFDDEVHDFRVTIDDRLLVMNIWIDEDQVVTNFAIGAYVTQTNFDLHIQGAGLTRWTISNVLVTRGIHPTQSALTDPAPWVEYEKIFDVRLDGDYIDIVDGAEPSPSGGTTEFVSISNPSASADTRPGAEAETAADPLRGMPRILARDYPAAEVKELALERWDPANPDGFLEIGSFRPAGSYRTGVGRRQLAVISYNGPAPDAVIGGGFRLPTEARFESVTIAFEALTREEYQALRRNWRVYGLERPFSVLIFADDLESSAPFESFWGLLLDEPRAEERPTDTLGRFGVTIELAVMMIEPQRL